ncbi:hypothetical protein DPMN_108027 [Dreissena polymorpha]|uniref:Uncharacterized protein n=1 Tax=Dreissena polymorpha TaxID=45954 RepID=A0A9D4K852_DREPO|nr:hypothetical protein DPMN_108027 [Dreissena polymorpha]
MNDRELKKIPIRIATATKFPPHKARALQVPHNLHPTIRLRDLWLLHAETEGRMTFLNTRLLHRAPDQRVHPDHGTSTCWSTRAPDTTHFSRLCPKLFWIEVALSASRNKLAG